jgi:hypothetical protein
MLSSSIRSCWVLRVPRRRRRNRCRHAFHVAQDALHHLLEIGLALAQVVVFHLVKLAGNHLELRGQRPLGVVQALGHPVLDTADQFFILKQHQVHIQQRRQFTGRLFGAHGG